MMPKTGFGNTDNAFPVALYNDGTAIVDGGEIIAAWNDDLELQIDMRHLHPGGDHMIGRVEVIVPDHVYAPNGVRALRGALHLPDGGVRFQEMVIFSDNEEWESERITVATKRSLDRHIDTIIIRAFFEKRTWKAQVSVTLDTGG